MSSLIEALPLDIIRLILESFLFKSTHTFKDVVSFARSSKRNYSLLKEGWLKRLYDHEFYLYIRRTRLKQGVFYCEIPDIVKTLKVQRVLKRKRGKDGDPDKRLIRRLTRGKSWS